MILSIISSIIDLNPRAPVLLSIASFASSFKAAFSNLSVTSSISKSLIYCLIKAFLGSVKIWTISSSVISFNVASIWRRPINSGINPYLTKSSVSTFEITSLSSFLLFASWLKPKTLAPSFFFMISSKPSKAPPHINNMFVVSTWSASCPGCFLPPLAGTFTVAPSTILSKACWTPSPETSLVMDLFSLILATLSTSSIKIIPLCAFSISPPAAWTNLVTTFSTSSPTYPASVKDVASAIAKGTSRYFEIVWANNVLPEPVGPINKTFDLFNSVSSFISWCLNILL